jgi:hypothetical protein
LLNRATGRCVCDDDPTLAVPVEDKGAPAAESTSTAALNGSAGTTVTLVAPDVAQELGVSRLDTDIQRPVATPAGLPPLPQQISSLNGERPIDAPPSRAAVELPPLGRLRTVLGDMRDGVRRVDVRIHEDSLVIDEVPGLDPVLVGRVAGTLLLGPLGLILGDAIGRRRARSQRRRRMSNAGMHEHGQRLPMDQVVAVTVKRLPWGGLLHIGAGGLGSRTLRWSKRDLDANDVAGQLQAMTTRRFSMEPMPNGLGVAHRVGTAVLVLAALVTVALPVKAIAFPPPEPGADLPAAARDALHDACPVWRAAPLSGAGLAQAAAQVRPQLELAAAAAPEFASLGADIALIESFAPKAGTANAPLTEAAQFSAAVSHVDAACARVGR